MFFKTMILTFTKTFVRKRSEVELVRRMPLALSALNASIAADKDFMEPLLEVKSFNYSVFDFEEHCEKNCAVRGF